MAANQEIAIVVLAAGRSARFGTADKLAARFGDSTVLAAALRAYQNLPAAHHYLIVAPQSDFAVTARAAGFDVLVNAQADEGMGGSIACGMRAVLAANPAPSHVLIGLGDMPRIAPATLVALCHKANNKTDIIVPTWQGKRGHPRLFGAAHFTALANLHGDKGARALVSGSRAVTEVEGDAGIIADIDTTDDLARLN